MRIRCPKCDGCGVIESSYPVLDPTCAKCLGRGYILIPDSTNETILSTKEEEAK